MKDIQRITQNAAILVLYFKDSKLLGPNRKDPDPSVKNDGS